MKNCHAFIHQKICIILIKLIFKLRLILSIYNLLSMIYFFQIFYFNKFNLLSIGFIITNHLDYR